jgi:hypothetical protein
MAIETVFEDLDKCGRRMSDAVAEVLVTVTEDAPNGELALVDLLGYDVDDLAEWTREAAAAAAESRRLREERPAEARRALARSQELWTRSWRKLSFDLLSYDRVSELMSVGRGRSRSWAPWAKSVRQGLEGCRGPLDEYGSAVARCWQELAERACAPAIALQTTGQVQVVRK